MSDNTYSMNN